MAKKTESDKVLVKRVQQGDKRAFDMLVMKYQHKIIALASRFVSFDEAPDVAQEAFIKAYRALPKFRGDSQFYTWLYRIAANTAKNHLATRSRRPKTQDILPEDAEFIDSASALRTSDSPEKIAQADELEQAVKQAIADLPDDLRTALCLREYDGLSYEEISEVMSCPIGTVRSRIFRARESIDEIIQQMLDPDIS